jgi:hypothetical protein
MSDHNNNVNENTLTYISHACIETRPSNCAKILMLSFFINTFHFALLCVFHAKKNGLPCLYTMPSSIQTSTTNFIKNKWLQLSKHIASASVGWASSCEVQKLPHAKIMPISVRQTLNMRWNSNGISMIF